MKLSSQKAVKAAASPSSVHQRWATCSTPRRMRSACCRPCFAISLSIVWRTVSAVMEGWADTRATTRGARHSRSIRKVMRRDMRAPFGSDRRLERGGDQALVDEQLVHLAAVLLDLLAGEGIELERLDDTAIDRLERAGADAAALGRL